MHESMPLVIDLLAVAVECVLFVMISAVPVGWDHTWVFTTWP
jgi:hypothetical protein